MKTWIKYYSHQLYIFLFYRKSWVIVKRELGCKYYYVEDVKWTKVPSKASEFNFKPEPGYLSELAAFTEIRYSSRFKKIKL